MFRPFLHLFIILLIASACNKNERHIITPLDSVAREAIRTQMIAFSDSIDQLAEEINPQQSLTYSRADYSFYVNRYIRNSAVSLYIENGRNASRGDNQNRYYLKDGKILLTTRTIYKLNSKKLTRTFYLNGEPLFSDEETYEHNDKDIPITKEFLYENIVSDIERLNDAIYQRNLFDLTFEGITDYPKAKYLVLSREKFNTYQAALRIQNDDEFIVSIMTNPEKFRGRKLNLTWKILNGEAVYVSGRLAD